MLGAGSFEEAAKILTDCGYEDMSAMNSSEIDAALNRHRSEIFSEISRLSPDSEIADIFRMKYDCHNAKVILKSEASGTPAEHLLSGSGRIDGAKLAAYYAEEKYSAMPGRLGRAMEEAKAVLARTGNPQAADFMLDRAYFAEMLDTAEKSGNDFLLGYVKLMADAANLKAAVRTLRMGKSPDFLSDALIPGGNIDKERLISAGDADAAAAVFAGSALEKAAAAGAEAAAGGSLTAFELACDNAVNAYLKRSKLVSFGSEPVAAYLAAVENEITAVRMILTGRLAGIKSEILSERLRDMYA